MSRSKRDLDLVVIGGGSFGTALAELMVGLGRSVVLVVRRDEQAMEINNEHRNSRYLGDRTLSDSLVATTNLEGSIERAPVVLMVVPSKSFREVARKTGNVLTGDQILVHGTKGIEQDTFKRMSQILREETCTRLIGAISGPNLAGEIAAGAPAGALLASRYDIVCEAIGALFSGSNLRLYKGSDVVGAEIGGAFKNIIALAAGMVDGLGLGDNSKSLLMTRGLSEMARFGVALGAEALTFGGLAGIGDLITTCASPLSRNNQVGRRLAGGESLESILFDMTQVAEGVSTTRAVYLQAESLGLDLPIVEAVYAILYQNKPIGEAIDSLMARPVGREFEAKLKCTRKGSVL